MRYFLDTEFHDTATGTELISLGLVDMTGREFYAVSSQFDRAAVAADPWLAEHVVPYLEQPESPAPIPAAQIAADVSSFCAEVDDGRKPQVWAWNGAFDFYLFTKLFGRREQIPAHVPRTFFDLKQWAYQLGNVSVPDQSSGHHHALADAHHDRSAWQWLSEFERLKHQRRDEKVRRRLVEHATVALRTVPLG